ncbi:MAG: hypothetical protein PHQ27_09935, partial [Victivallales bacterium]|nr:hypothetical protein [Victivallales bacterium]
MYGFYRVAAAAPELRLADIPHNIGRILALIREAETELAAAVVLPELAVTGYTCGDLFRQSQLLLAAEDAIVQLADATAAMKIVIAVGAPLVVDNAVYNCAFILHHGEILGIVPKSLLPNYREFYEKRWFASGAAGPETMIEFHGRQVPFGTRLLFRHDRYFRFGAELCEDLWGVIPPSSRQCLDGALLTFNLSASNELVAKAEYRRELVRQQSARCISGYIYASSGVHESTQDLVFGGHLLIAANGRTAAENQRFQRKGEVIYADIDCQRLLATRLTESPYSDCRRDDGNMPFREIAVGAINHISELKYVTINPQPFVPAEKDTRHLRCREIFQIQTAGLAKRLEHTGSPRAV